MTSGSASLSSNPYRFVVAPRFSIRAGLAEHLERNNGIRHEGTLVLPRDDWRPLTAAELGSIVQENAGRDAVVSPAELALIQIPEALRIAWWAEAEKSEAEVPLPSAFESVFAKVVEFLRFKRLPLPEQMSLHVAVTAPGLASTRMGTEGGGGLGFGEPHRPVACINFDDEPGFVVLCELPPPALVQQLATSIGVEKASALSPSELVTQFFTAFPDRPLLRVRLDPGEGIWLSPLGVIHDGWTQDKRDLDVMLHLAAGSSLSSLSSEVP
jgi:hypothetical protein